MELHQLLPDFRMESFEWIESMEGSLLYLEDTPGCRAAANDLFRAICTMKESAGLFGLDHVVVLAGAMENVLVRVCRGEVPTNEPLITLLLSCCAHMRALIGQTSSEWIGRPDPDWENGTTEDELLDQLRDISSKPSWLGAGAYLNRPHFTSLPPEYHSGELSKYSATSFHLV